MHRKIRIRIFGGVKNSMHNIALQVRGIDWTMTTYELHQIEQVLHAISNLQHQSGIRLTHSPIYVPAYWRKNKAFFLDQEPSLTCRKEEIICSFSIDCLNHCCPWKIFLCLRNLSIAVKPEKLINWCTSTSCDHQSILEKFGHAHSNDQRQKQDANLSVMENLDDVIMNSSWKAEIYDDHLFSGMSTCKDQLIDSFKEKHLWLQMSPFTHANNIIPTTNHLLEFT